MKPIADVRMRGLALAVVTLWGTSAFAQAPSPSALLFGKKCSACHTLGEGDRVGPDLVGATDRRDRAWLSKFIVKPGAAIASGDATAKGLLDKFKIMMPDQELTEGELNGLIDYLAECTKAGKCKVATGTVKNASEATPEEIAKGRNLYLGEELLANGGPACMSCHNVRGEGLFGGGTIAKDLTFVYARLGDSGLQSALEATPFPLMKHVYGAQVLTPEEAFALKGYFAQVAKDGSQPKADHNFFYAGVIGLFLGMGLIGFIWSGKKTGIRQRIVNGDGGRK